MGNRIFYQETNYWRDGSIHFYTDYLVAMGCEQWFDRYSTDGGGMLKADGRWTRYVITRRGQKVTIPVARTLALFN